MSGDKTSGDEISKAGRKPAAKTNKPKKSALPATSGFSAVAPPNSFRSGPDDRGYFGLFGGRFVAETLMPLILELEQAYTAARNDAGFKAELTDLNTHYSGRPSPLYYADRLTRHFGGAKIYLKRDELNHTGSHKINNCLGQILLARRMGKTRIIAETGAGQHGVAVATVCAKYGMPCEIQVENLKRLNRS